MRRAPSAWHRRIIRFHKRNLPMDTSRDRTSTVAPTYGYGSGPEWVASPLNRRSSRQCLSPKRPTHGSPATLDLQVPYEVFVSDAESGWRPGGSLLFVLFV